MSAARPPYGNPRAAARDAGSDEDADKPSTKSQPTVRPSRTACKDPITTTHFGCDGRPQFEPWVNHGVTAVLRPGHVPSLQGFINNHGAQGSYVKRWPVLYRLYPAHHIIVAPRSSDPKSSTWLG